MRSKEVEEAIKSLNINKTMVLKGGDSCIASVDNIETVLAYIEELEKDVKDAMDGYQDLGKEVYFNFISKDKIRDKIKEYRTQGRYSYWEEIMALEGLLDE